MGIRMELEDGEPIADALRRLRKLILAEDVTLLYPNGRWDKKRRDVYTKPCVLRRRRRWLIRARRKRCAIRSPAPEAAWADDLCNRPRRSYGPMGRYVAT